jgi:chromosome segregation ATPase
MTQSSELLQKTTYTFRNEDSTPRTVIVEHPVRPGYELRGAAKPEETTSAWMRFRLRVDPKQTSDLIVEEATPVRQTFALTNITPIQVEIFLQRRSIDKTIEEALRKIIAQKTVVAGLTDKKDAGEEETSHIFDDQQRLRENMKSLKGSADERALLQRYTRQLNDEEDRLDALKKEAAQLETQIASEQATLDKMIQSLALDVKL